MTYTYTVVINKERKYFVARALELGVVSQGKNIEDAKENLKEAVDLYLEDAPGVKRNLSKERPLVTSIEVTR